MRSNRAPRFDVDRPSKANANGTTLREQHWRQSLDLPADASRTTASIHAFANQSADPAASITNSTLEFRAADFDAEKHLLE
jgi:hypothetical protein